MPQAERKKRFRYHHHHRRQILSPLLEKLKVFRETPVVRVFLAEFISTYVMMVFGLGSVAHMVLGSRYGSFLAVNIGFGFGVTMGIHLAGAISGAHMNAAVTFATCAMGRMPWKKFPLYVTSQFLGSFMAAATIYSLFYGAIRTHAGGRLVVSGPFSTAGIFATYLPEHMTLWRGFLDEVVVTGMLQLCLLAITDRKNNPAGRGMEAEVIGILIITIGVSFGMNSGYAMNPSRDLPPRIFSFLAGWGADVFRVDNWWWVPVVAPLLGAYLGSLIYTIFIGYIVIRPPEPHPETHPETAKAVEEQKITVLPKSTTQTPMSTPITPVAVHPEKSSNVVPASVNERH